MIIRDYINFLNVIEKMKCNTRHSWTSSGRQESVAEHSWRLAVMAMMCQDEYPNLDLDRVIKMCLIHDIGEAVLGDIPAFLKTEQDENDEKNAVNSLFTMLPDEMRSEWQSLYNELLLLETDEAKLFKSLDNMEGLISHNEADISTWIPLEYEVNLTYGQNNVEWSEWTRKLKDEIKKDSILKIEKSNNN